MCTAALHKHLCAAMPQLETRGSGRHKRYAQPLPVMRANARQGHNASMRQ
jgi:hypothetical protein